MSLADPRIADRKGKVGMNFHSQDGSKVSEFPPKTQTFQPLECDAEHLSQRSRVDDDPRLPLYARALIIFGASISLWVAIFGIIWLIEQFLI